jgi:hypothetical protein
MEKKRNKTQKAFSFFLLMSCMLTFSRCKKDQLQTSSTPVDSTSKSLSLTAKTLATTTTYNITSSLPAGYVKDGSVDYTTYVQNAINKYSNITFPAFPIMIDDKGLTIGSNKTITFLTGSKLLLKPTASSNYNILNILDATNVVLTGPVIVGDRNTHLGTSGEWGQGIGIYGSTNVTINGANVTYCWGDGIYLAAKGTINNKNITIKNATSLYNRRNGISVTNAIGLDLESPYAGYSNGVAPFTGIDIEPSSYADEIQNIVLNNPNTAYNPGMGISVGFKNLFGGPNKTIGIQINNHNDKGSGDAFKATATLTQRKGTETVTGNINILNPVWRKNTVAPIQTNLLVKTIKLTITNPAVETVSGTLLSDASILSLFTYKTNINYTANYVINF